MLVEQEGANRSHALGVFDGILAHILHVAISHAGGSGKQQRMHGQHEMRRAGAGSGPLFGRLYFAGHDRDCDLFEMPLVSARRHLGTVFNLVFELLDVIVTVIIVDVINLLNMVIHDADVLRIEVVKVSLVAAVVVVLDLDVVVLVVDVHA